jgi:competence protein ComEC
MMLFFVLTVYVGVVGFQIPIVRAFVMRTHLFLGQYFFHRRLHSGYSLILLCGVVALLFSKQLTRVSFQYSYGATGALLYLLPLAYQAKNAEIFTEQVDSDVLHLQKKNVISYIFDQFLVFTVVSVALLPLTLYHFGVWNPLGIIFTCLLAPLVTALYLVTGVITVGLLLLPSEISFFCLMLPIHIAQGITALILPLLTFAAQLDFLIVHLRLSLNQVFFAYILLFSTVITLLFRRKRGASVVV